MEGKVKIWLWMLLALCLVALGIAVTRKPFDHATVGILTVCAIVIGMALKR